MKQFQISHLFTVTATYDNKTPMDSKHAKNLGSLPRRISYFKRFRHFELLWRGRKIQENQREIRLFKLSRNFL